MDPQIIWLQIQIWVLKHGGSSAVLMILLEVVACGLPLWHGAQIALDTTLVSPVRRDGQPHPGAAEHAAFPFDPGGARRLPLARVTRRSVLKALVGCCMGSGCVGPGALGLATGSTVV